VSVRGEFLGCGDVTNVTLCGQSVLSIVSQSPTQVVVVAASAPAAVTGAVTVCSISFGVTTRSNGYAYAFMPRIFATAGPGGTVAPSGAVYVAYGATTSFAVSAASYYHVATLHTNGVSAGYGGATNVSLAWPAIVADGTLEAAFTANLVTNNVPEWWLHRYYPAASDFLAAALSDTDADGMSAWGEYHARTDPTNGLSVLAITAFAKTGADRVFSWQSATGCTYSLQASTNLQVGFDILWKGGILATPPLESSQRSVGS
jgi:hypothetical protein